MPLKFEVKKKLISRSERVKCVELHPDMPWVLVSLYSGNITIYDYSNQSTVKTFENSVSPVRAAKFCVRKQWIVAGADDLQMRVYNYNTMEKRKQWDGHTDYIRCIVVHPTQPYILSSSDDASIKIWDFDRDFALHRELVEHQHYVMMLAINPRDLNTFASGSLDKTIKIWSFSGGKQCNFTLTGHTAGINCVDYFKGDKPYIISGADDKAVKIWDYQTKQCIHTLEGHSNNISYTMFHPELPIIITSAEDGLVKLWHSQTFKLETSLNYNMERVWCVDIGKDNNNILAFGYDEGTVVVKIGSDEPVVSMNNGKIIYAKNCDINTANLKAVGQVEEGENININKKELGSVDFYPLCLRHSQNGHLVAVCNDSEYAIYRSNNLKSQGYGTGTDLVWRDNNAADYAVKENFVIKIYKGNNVLHCEMKTDYLVEGLYGGPLLAAKSSEYVIFYDWELAKVVRRIDIAAKKIIWNEAGTHIIIQTADEFYALEYKAELTKQLLEQEENPEGYEESFELLYEIHEQITSGLWIEKVFYYTSQNGKINYSLMGKIFNFGHTDKKKFLLGYIQIQNRLYLIDKFFNIISYDLQVEIPQYQTAISQKDFALAEKILPKINEKWIDKIARFLDSIDMKQEAFNIVLEKDHKFELALALGKIDEAFLIADEQKNGSQYKQVGDISLLNGNIDLAVKCFKSSDDLGSLLLIYSSLGLKDNLKELAQKAEDMTRMNIAFTCYFLIADLDKCIDVLVKSGRVPEAGLFCKTYRPSRITEIVQLWKTDLEIKHPLTAKKVADPMDYIEEDSFSDLKQLLKLEKFYDEQRSQEFVPAHHFAEYSQLLSADLFKALKEDESRNLDAISVVPKNIQQNNPFYNNDEQNNVE